MCGRLGHSDRDCEVVYANPHKEIDRAYGVWLRAPGKNARNQVLASRWLRNGRDGGQGWEGYRNAQTTAHGSQQTETQFMETDGVLSEIPASEGGILVQIRQEGNSQSNIAKNQGYTLGGKEFENEIVVTDAKRKRFENLNEGNNGLVENDGQATKNTENSIEPKNGLEAGPGIQARLGQ